MGKVYSWKMTLKLLTDMESEFHWISILYSWAHITEQNIKNRLPPGWKNRSRLFKLAVQKSQLTAILLGT